MKFLFLASAAAAVSAQIVDLDDASVSVRERFEAFEQQFDKAYATKDDREKAFRTFANNDKRVQDVNSQGLEYTFGHNEFSDLTADEFADMMISGYEAPNHELNIETSLSEVDVESLPKSVDWVNAGAVNAIKNQGQCGSCWAFSTVMGIEGDLFVETGALLDLSEQDLVSCDPVDQGCNGGLMDQAFQYVEKNGICNETDYPYTAGTGTSGQCEHKCTPAVKITGYKDVPSKDEDALQAAVAQQPVSVAIEADRSVFQLYKSGVLSSPFCGTQLDHGVGIVGYGSSAFNTPYWKVRNSWGESWGMQGYVLLKRGTNECGISQQASYPTGAHQI